MKSRILFVFVTDLYDHHGATSWHGAKNKRYYSARRRFRKSRSTKKPTKYKQKRHKQGKGFDQARYARNGMSSKAKPQLDSCLNFAHEAMALSQKLHYTYGFTESALVLCKVYLYREDFNSTNQVLQLTSGEERVRLLILMAEHYIFMDVSPDNKNVNQAEKYLTAARQLANQIHSEKMAHRKPNRYGKVLFCQRGPSERKKLFF